MFPERKISHAGNLDMPNRSSRVFPLIKKVNALNKERHCWLWLLISKLLFIETFITEYFKLSRLGL